MYKYNLFIEDKEQVVPVESRNKIEQGDTINLFDTENYPEETYMAVKVIGHHVLVERCRSYQIDVRMVGDKKEL